MLVEDMPGLLTTITTVLQEQESNTWASAKKMAPECDN